MNTRFQKGDALIPVDLINAFGKDGELPVPGTENFLPAANELVQEFLNTGCPVIDVHDEHPVGSKHFEEQGGPWKIHALKGTWSAEFLPGYFRDLRMQHIPKGTTGKDNGYSGFDDTPLNDELKRQGVKRIYIIGVATKFCVKETAVRGHELGYEVIVLTDLIRSIDINPGDGIRALLEMQELGITLMDSKDI